MLVNDGYLTVGWRSLLPGI